MTFMADLSFRLSNSNLEIAFPDLFEALGHNRLMASVLQFKEAIYSDLSSNL